MTSQVRGSRHPGDIVQCPLCPQGGSLGVVMLVLWIYGDDDNNLYNDNDVTDDHGYDDSYDNEDDVEDNDDVMTMMAGSSTVLHRVGGEGE